MVIQSYKITCQLSDACQKQIEITNSSTSAESMIKVHHINILDPTFCSLVMETLSGFVSKQYIQVYYSIHILFFFLTAVI